MIKIYSSFKFQETPGLDFVKNPKMADIIILNVDQNELMKYSFMKFLNPFWRVKLVSVDILLRPIGPGFKAKVMAEIKKILFKKVDLFLLYFKNTDGYTRTYGIQPKKIRYIPFKVNSWEKIQNFPNTDKKGEYILCAGRTLRDIETYLKALEISGLPGILLVQDKETMRGHGTSVDQLNLPKNGKIEIHSDGQEATFLKWIAEARIVVVPRFKKDIASTGISTYLCAMGLKRPVIISRGPGAEDILLKNEALFYSPEDANVLAPLLLSLWNDDNQREQVASAGYEYASKLGGEARLLADILRASTEK